MSINRDEWVCKTPDEGRKCFSDRPVWGLWLLPALWGALILTLSTQPGSFFVAGAQELPNGLAHYALEILVHVVEFGIFFLLMIRPLQSYRLSQMGVLVSAFGVVLLFSICNESVQAFIPTRTFDVLDIVIDGLGGSSAAVLTLLRDKTSGIDTQTRLN